jgi:hypothetical protein
MRSSYRMGSVKRAFSLAAAAIVMLGCVFAGTVWAQDDDGPMSDLKFVVVRDYSGKPVRNAAVVLHPVSRKGRQARGGLELKTDNEGRASIDGIPYGPLRVQVLAPGYQTFGEDYEINKPELEITVKLKRPGGQFSVYTDPKKPDDKPAGKKATDEKAGDTKPGDVKASDAKASDAKASEAKPGDPKPQQ